MRNERRNFNLSSESYGPSFARVFQESVASLRLLGKRSWIALLGILVGTASIVALLEIGENATAEAVRIFKGLGTDTLLVNLQPQFMAPEHPKKSPCLLGAEVDFRTFSPKIQNLVALVPMAVNSVQIRAKQRTLHAALVGTSEDLVSTLQLSIAQGRFLSPFDEKEAFVVVGAKIASELATQGRALLVGDFLQLDERMYQVIGILEAYPFGALIPFSVNDSLMIPLKGFKRFHAPVRVSSLVARVASESDIETTASLLAHELQETFGDCGFDVQIPKKLLDGLQQQSRTFSYLLVGLGALSLLGGGIGVMNVMLMSIAARRQEIGIRIALGARPQDICLLFLTEAMLLSIVGALMGALIGLAVSYFFVLVSGWVFVFSPLALLLGTACSLLTGFFFGLAPALSAAKLQPVQVLRDA